KVVALCACALLAFCSSAPVSPPRPGGDYDLVLANGRVVDGTGAPWLRADVGTQGDRSPAVGDLPRAGAVRRTDVRHRMVGLGLGDVQPTPEQLAEMERVTARGMEQGALGVSSALIYPPGSYARTPELVALARVAARYGGVYASHIRGEADGVLDALEEAITIGRQAGIPVEIWHLKAAGRNNWGRLKEIVARIERAR